MIRLLSLIIFYLFFASPVHAQTQLNDLERIRKSGVLRVALAAEPTPPFSFSISNGQKIGMDIDLAETMAKRIGVKLVWVMANSFSETIEILNSGKADVAISSLYPTLERLELAHFSDPYFQLHKYLFVNRVIASRLHLPHEYLGLILNERVTVGYLEQFFLTSATMTKAIWKPYKLDKTSDGIVLKEILQDFLQEKITATYLDEVELGKLRKLKPDLDLFGFAVEIPDSSQPVSMAIPRGHPQLRDWVNLFINEVGQGKNLELMYQYYLKKAKDGHAL